MANNIEISILASVEKATKSVQGLEKEFLSLSKTVKLAGAVVASVFTATKVVDFLVDATNAAKNFENALTGVQSVANAFAISADDVTEAVKNLASDGLIPVEDVASSLKNLLSSGLGLDESIKLFNALKDSAAFNRQGFLSLGEAITGATQGIKNGNSTLVDNAGVTKNLSVLQKEYAQSIGTTVGRLTEAQRIQAIYTGILREAAIFSGDAAKLSDSYAGATARLSASYDKLLVSVGKFVTESTIIRSITNGISEAFDFVSKSLDDLRKNFSLTSIAVNTYIAVVKNIANAFDIDALKKVAKNLENNKHILLGTSDSAKKATDEVKKFTKAATNNAPVKTIEEQRSALDKLKDSFANLRQEVDKQIQQFAQKPFDLLFNLQANTIDFERRIIDLNNAFKEGSITQDVYLEGVQAIQKAQEEAARNQIIGTVSGFLNAAVSGRAGAEKLVSNLASAATNAIIPGLGDALGPLFDAFAKGPEEVRKMVREFTQSLPEIINGFIQAVPVFIEELLSGVPQIIIGLLNSLPDLIDGLIAAIPNIIQGFVDNLPQLIQAIIARLPEIVTKLAIAFATQIPAAFIKSVPSIIEAIVRGLRDGLIELINNIIDSVTGFVSDPIGGIGDFFGFAKGGQAFSVKGGTSGQDSVPAMLMPGELVVDRSTAFALKDFLANQGTNDYDVVVASKLANIEELLKNPQVISGDVNIGYSVLSEAIFKLNRSNARLA